MAFAMTLAAQPEHFEGLCIILMVSVYSGFAAAILANVFLNKRSILYGGANSAMGVDFLAVFVLPLAYLCVELFFVVLTPITQISRCSFEVLTDPAAMVGFESVFIRGKPFSSFGLALV